VVVHFRDSSESRGCQTEDSTKRGKSLVVTLVVDEGAKRQSDSSVFSFVGYSDDPLSLLTYD